MAPINILLFLKFFYLKSKSDDFINSNNVITRNIKKSNVERKLPSPTLNTRNKLGLCDSMVRLLRFFVRHPNGNNIFTGATLRAGFRLRYYNYYNDIDKINFAKIYFLEISAKIWVGKERSI